MHTNEQVVAKSTTQLPFFMQQLARLDLLSKSIVICIFSTVNKVTQYLIMTETYCHIRKKETRVEKWEERNKNKICQDTRSL